MAADKPEVFLSLHTRFFDIWTETLLSTFLKTNKLAQTTP